MIDDKPDDLGDPLVAQPGDPQTMVLHVDARDVQAIVTGLNKLPSEVSRLTLNKLEGQVRAAVLDVRRELRAARKAQDGERLAVAEARRQRRRARHARVNGTPEAPPAQ